MADTLSGSGSAIRIEAAVVGSSAAGKWWDVHVRCTFFERSSSPLTYSSAAWNVGGGLPIVGGIFDFDWRPGGLQAVVFYEQTIRIYANPDGTPPGYPSQFAAAVYVGDTGTSAGGPGGTATEYLTLPVLKVAPATPSPVSAVRNTDTQATVSWTQPAPATNGDPTSHTVRKSTNGGAFDAGTVISPATSLAVAIAANQKVVFGVRAGNAAGSSAWSADSAPIYTTPAAPTGLVATKVGSDIQLAWANNVGFSEYQTEIEHGVDVAGVVTWDGSILATKSSGVGTHTHSAPNPAQRHVYRARAKNTAVGALTSAWVTSNVVQLLTAPAKPSVGSPAAFQDRAATFRFAWTHNPIDSSAQTKRQTRYSTNGGSSWTTSAKTPSTDQFVDYAGGTFSANQQVLFQVRTKGSYDSGSDGDASYSPWSDSVTVTFKSKPVATISSPANASTYTQAALSVVLGFSQPESATFVSATIGLYNAAGTVLLEQIVSNTLAGTAFTTRLADQTSYTIKATVTDSNGITSALVSSAFSVDYTEPVPPRISVDYLDDTGLAQIGVRIPAPSATRVVAQSISGHPGVGSAVPAGYEFSHRQPFNLPVAPSEWRIHVRNRNFLTDVDYSGTWVIDAFVGQSAGVNTGNFQSAPLQVLDAATMVDGAELVSAWSSAPLAADVELLLSIGAKTNGDGSTIAVNPNPAWTNASAANADALAPTHYYSPASGLLDAWIEYRVPVATPALLTIGHSLNGPGNVNPGVHPWYADQQSWMGQWALALNGINCSLTVAGSWPGHYSNDSPKWNYYADVEPSVVALWTMSSLIQGGGSLAECQAELLRLITKVRGIWGDSIPILVFTEPGRIDLDAPGDAVRVAYNDWVLTNPFGARAIVDADDVLTDPGSSPGRLKPAIDADGFHFTLTGHTNIAGAAVPALAPAPAIYVAATTVSIERIIDGVSEPVASAYPVAPNLTFLDTTPTIHGTNLYRVTTRSVDGATSVATAELITAEDEWLFLSKGPAFDQIVKVGGRTPIEVVPSVDGALFKAAGRRRPIARYSSTTGDLEVKGSGDLAPLDGGSTAEELQALLGTSGTACLRHPSGLRVFGRLIGSIPRTDADLAQLTYSLTETD